MHEQESKMFMKRIVAHHLSNAQRIGLTSNRNIQAKQPIIEFIILQIITENGE